MTRTEREVATDKDFGFRKHTAVDHYLVSTTGEFSYGSMSCEPGDIYETMVFPIGVDGKVTRYDEQDMRRYRTKRAALLGHEEMVAKWEDRAITAEEAPE